MREKQPHRRLVRSLEREIAVVPWRSGITIDVFSESDLPAAHSLLAASYGAVGTPLPNLALWWESIATDEEFDPGLLLVAKTAGGEIAGFALVWNSAFVKDLVVAPQWRKQGIATALLHESFRRLSAMGHSSVALKVEIGNPTGAERLYEALGFVDG